MSKSGRAKLRRPKQHRTAPETELRDALLAGVDSPTPGPLLGVVGSARTAERAASFG
jgi:hypothetical protein